MKNHDTKGTRKAARKYERERWARIIDEMAFIKDLDSGIQYTHQVLAGLADNMRENKTPKL